MEEPSGLWIMIANLTLALVVVTCLSAVLFAILQEAIDRVRTRARLSAERKGPGPHEGLLR